MAQLKSIPYEYTTLLRILYACAYLYDECIVNLDILQPEDSIKDTGLRDQLLAMKTPETVSVEQYLGISEDIWETLQHIEDSHGQKITLQLLADFCNLYPDFAQEVQDLGYRYLLEQGADMDRIHMLANLYMEHN